VVDVSPRAKPAHAPKMQPTLIRFGPELFEELKAEAAASGVSVAQYVREAVVARMAYTAGLRGEPGYGLGADGPHDGVREAASSVRSEAAQVREESRAVRAESRQAQIKTRDLQYRSAGR
jgi:hypothetical protein